MSSGGGRLVQVQRRGLLQHVPHADPRGGPAVRYEDQPADSRRHSFSRPLPPRVKPIFPCLLHDRRQLRDGHGCSGALGQRAEGGPAVRGHPARLHPQLHVRSKKQQTNKQTGFLTEKRSVTNRWKEKKRVSTRLAGFGPDTTFNERRGEAACLLFTVLNAPMCAGVAPQQHCGSEAPVWSGQRKLSQTQSEILGGGLAEDTAVFCVLCNSKPIGCFHVGAGKTIPSESKPTTGCNSNLPPEA